LHEVEAELEFITPCLGNNRDRSRVQRLLKRKRTGQIVLLQTWWRNCLAYGAEAVGRDADLVGQVQADPLADVRVEASISRSIRDAAIGSIASGHGTDEYLATA